MRFKPFIFVDGQVVLNKEEILLYPEFKAVWDDPRNNVRGDKEGKQHQWAYKVFTYIYLTEDFKSDYWELSEEERMKTALDDTGMQKADLYEPIVLSAIRKYQAIQDTRSLKFLRAAHALVDKLRMHLETINFEEVDEKGQPKYKWESVMPALKNLGSALDGLEELEHRVKKEMERGKGVRGDSETGNFD